MRSSSTLLRYATAGLTLLAAWGFGACGGEPTSAPAEPAGPSDTTSTPPTPDTTAPAVTILSPVTGETEIAEFPRFRARISGDSHITDVTWLFDDGSGAPPVEMGFDWGQGYLPYLDARYLLAPVQAGTYTIRASATDSAGNTGTSAPVTVTFGHPDTATRIVVRAFSVIEYEEAPGSGRWSYAPQLVVADVPGGSGLEIVGFEMLEIPGLTVQSGRAWARYLDVPPDQDRALFQEVYGDYELWLGDAAGAGRRSDGGQARARLTYRDDVGEFHATTIEGAIVTGTLPQTYTGGCGHWGWGSVVYPATSPCD